MKTLVFVMWWLSASFTFHGQAIRSKDATPISVDFHKALAEIRQTTKSWRALLLSVKVDDLPVSYAIGKTMQQTIEIANKDIDKLIDSSDEELRKPTLSGEIALMSDLQSLESDIQAAASVVVAFDMPTAKDAKKVTDWGIALANLAAGPVQTLWAKSYTSVLTEAAELEKRCSTKIP